MENMTDKELLDIAIERMNRARSILTFGNPRPECNWGMLDTSDLVTNQAPVAWITDEYVKSVVVKVCSEHYGEDLDIPETYTDNDRLFYGKFARALILGSTGELS